MHCNLRKYNEIENRMIKNTFLKTLKYINSLCKNSHLELLRVLYFAFKRPYSPHIQNFSGAHRCCSWNYMCIWRVTGSWKYCDSVWTVFAFYMNIEHIPVKRFSISSSCLPPVSCVMGLLLRNSSSAWATDPSDLFLRNQDPWNFISWSEATLRYPIFFLEIL